MRFDLRKPCKDCPFLVGSSTNISLDEGRIEEIVKDLRDDMTFACHKTIKEYTDKKVDEQHCGGALIFLERENNPNNLMRVAERIGFYDRTKIDMDCKGLIDNDEY